MREIKFRFVIDNKKVTKPYSLNELIDYSKPLSEEDILDDAFECKDTHCAYIGYCECENDLKCITAKLQYTGLKDKNGVEIYDGYIVKVTHDYMEDTFHEIKWSAEEYYPAFDLYPNIGVESNGLNYIFTGSDTIEIIGNIYEKEII